MGNLTSIAGGKGNGPRDPKDDLWLRRQALQTVAQLPEDPGEALVVLQLAIELVRYLSDGLPVT